jgi:hypothetical protein
MSLEVAVERREMIVKAVKSLMREGMDGDYGTIPGTPKPTLLQPGADKLNNLFGLVPTFEVTDKDIDWTGERHGGEPFFFYEVKCRLIRGGYVMGEGDGSANSWESKHRYRKSERVCPACGTDSIIKGKPEYGGGWLCYAKKGGCGAKFKAGDPDIEEQQTGNVPNPNISDVVNTIRKIANKRAKIAATLNAVSAHEFFSQDIEDSRPQENYYEEVREQKPAATTKAAPSEPKTASAPGVITPAQRKRLFTLASNAKLEEAQLRQILGNAGYESSKEIKTSDYDKICSEIEELRMGVSEADLPEFADAN